MVALSTRTKTVFAAVGVGTYVALAFACDLKPESGSENDAALRAVLAEAPAEIGKRTRSSACEGSSLPDPECTPGDIFPDALLEHICADGYSRSVRNVGVSLKKRVYRAYGIPYPQPRGAYEVDHLIPLELGGSNDISNLFPQPKTPFPGFPEKDIIENLLHEEACAGNIGLREAQSAIAADWMKVYRSVDPKRIESLRKKYGNWADQAGS